MRNLFKKRQNKFMRLIHDQAALTLAGLDALKAYMEGQNGAAAAELIKTEKEADEVRRILIYDGYTSHTLEDMEYSRFKELGIVTNNGKIILRHDRRSETVLAEFRRMRLFRVEIKI